MASAILGLPVTGAELLLERIHGGYVPSLVFLLACIFVYAALYHIYTIEFKVLLFIGMSGLMVRLIAQKLFAILKGILFINDIISNPVSFSYALFYPLNLLLTVVTAIGIGFLLQKSIVYFTPDLEIRSIDLLIYFGVLLTTGVFGYLETSYVTAVNPAPLMRSYLALCVGELFYYFIVMVLMILLVQRSAAERSEQALRTLLAVNRRQHELTKDSIDIINARCHDLRHQIRYLSENLTSESEIKESMNEALDAIRIYDSRIHTGCDTLDVILTDWKLHYEAQQVAFTSIADGACLSGMNTQDIISVFGNLLENAFEYLKSIPEVADRFVNLDVRAHAGQTVIEVENTYIGPPIVSGQAPPTTKENSSHIHGYGIMSVQQIVKKYQGTFLISADREVFHVTIILPLSQSGRETMG